MYTAPYATVDLYHGSFSDVLHEGKCDYGTFYYSLNGGEFSTTLPTITEKGSYTLSWYIEGNEGYVSLNPGSLGDVTFTVKDFITIDEVFIPQAMSAKYTGEVTYLFNPGISYVEGLTFYYSPNKLDWSESPFDGYSDEGIYVLYYYCTGNENYNGIGNEQNPIKMTASISSKNLVIYEDIVLPCAAFATDYTGEDVTLLEKAIVLVDEEKIGKFYYSLDKVNWSTELPKAKEVGLYYVYYYLTDGTDYNGIGSQEEPIELIVEIYAPEE